VIDRGEAFARRSLGILEPKWANASPEQSTRAETQKELDALMPSILAKAFAGEL
jgi:hypothetical protein